MKQCNALATHYSAFVDGELTPLESVAIRKHIGYCRTCRLEVQRTEDLKLAVHVHGEEIQQTSNLQERIAAELARQDQQRTRRSKQSVLAGALAASMIAMLSLPWESPSDTVRPEGSSSPSLSAPTDDMGRLAPRDSALAGRRYPGTVRNGVQKINDSILAQLVEMHLEQASVQPSQSASILSFAALPMRNAVNASYPGCLQSRPTASLAVLDSSRMLLPPDVAESLDRFGVHWETRGRVEVRISEQSGRLFVLLTDAQSVEASPI